MGVKKHGASVFLWHRGYEYVLEVLEPSLIVKYGPDHKKIFDIHTASHHLGAPHYHMWKDGQRVSEGTDLTLEMKSLIDKVMNYKSKR